MKKRVSLVVLPLLAASSLAQDIPDEEEVEQEIRRYTVEMIIFAYNQNVSTGTEIFMPDEPPPEALLDEFLIEEFLIEEIPVPDIFGEQRKYELVMLAEEDFTMLDIIEQFDELDAYETLLHFGWIQPMYPEEDGESEALPLSSFVTPPEGLDGDLKLYLSRYLHLAVNLQLDAAAAIDPTDDDVEELLPVISFGDNVDTYNDFGEAVTVSYPTYYRIEEDRIFRNGELRYFDHPKFGVLAKITRVEEEEPAEDEFLDETELLGYDGE